MISYILKMAEERIVHIKVYVTNKFRVSSPETLKFGRLNIKTIKIN